MFNCEDLSKAMTVCCTKHLRRMGHSASASPVLLACCHEASSGALPCRDVPGASRGPGTGGCQHLSLLLHGCWCVRWSSRWPEHLGSHIETSTLTAPKRIASQWKTA